MNELFRCIPQELYAVSKFFAQNGFSSYIVGGAVRDMLLGVKPTDWDMASNAKPQEIIRLFRHVIPTGIAHGTVTVIFKGLHIEITTFRTEHGYSDGRHPDLISYATHIEQDLSRRDFTINAIALALDINAHKVHHIVDPYDGRCDLAHKIIRTVGNPHDRFSEDGLRPVRAIRFAARLDFCIEKATLDAIPLSLSITAKVAVERFREEFAKLLCTPIPSQSLSILNSTGILALFIPECRIAKEHSFKNCDGSITDTEHTLAVRLALFLNELISDDSVLQAEVILKRLRFSNDIIRYTLHLLSFLSYEYTHTHSDSDVRVFLSQAKPENLQDLYALHRAVCDSDTLYVQLIAFYSHIQVVLDEKPPLFLKDLCINGNDIQSMGIAQGKHIGIVLQFLLESVLENPTYNTRDILLEKAHHYCSSN